MSLAQQFDQVLRASRAPTTVDTSCGDDRLTCALLELDSIGVAVQRLELTTLRLADAAPHKLEQLADELTGRLTYLLEPIAAIEFDRESSTVQLRSRPPRRSETATSYYEVLITRGGSISLHRYDKPRGQVRDIVPYLVTREVLLRVIDDFAAIIH